MDTWANTTAQPTFNLKDLGKLPIPLPPPQERKEIAIFLSALDDRIALLREANATLEAIAQAMFKSWFVDFDPVHAKQQGRAPAGMSEATAALFPDSFEESELGLVPSGWSVGSIGKVAEVIDCLHAKKPELLECGSPYLQLNNIRDDGLLDTANLAFISDADYAKWISRIEVSGGDCVITNVGRVGAVAQIPESFRAAMGRNMTAIRMRKEWPYPTYLVELLQSPWMETEIQRRTDIGTILNALNVKNIPLLRCVLAGQDVLNAFEAVARPLRASMEANLQQAQTLATLRDTLLPRLISGQLRLPQAEAAHEEAAA
jgi:type I restriction enzyme S subunit